ncbi:DUF4177 domain-containing protein [Rhodobacter sp. NSM]|uniref:DUF4177 domain-containing protein n=1 Tax=Rhodobacter sp. NSM TaxID=3457501 RepID=UPI003FD5BC9B
MTRFEYKVVPAPRKGEKVKGLKTPSDRFAHSLTQVMNELGRDGWEYMRAETLPCEERAGFTGKTTTYQNLLIFRRSVEEVSSAGSQVDEEGLPPDLPAFFRPERATTQAQLAATLNPRVKGGVRALSAKAPQGHAPTVGPARGGGLAAE